MYVRICICISTILFCGSSICLSWCQYHIVHWLDYRSFTISLKVRWCKTCLLFLVPARIDWSHWIYRFCCYWVMFSVNVNQVNFVDSFIWIFYILADFLSILSIIERRVFKSPAIIVDLPVYCCSFISLFVFETLLF